MSRKFLVSGKWFVCSAVGLVLLAASASGQPARLGDLNGDGAVNVFDIDPFVACLTGGGCGHVEPIAWYPFDGNAQDYSGNGNSGVPRGGLVYGPGFVDQAAVFNGVDSAVKLYEPLNLVGTDYTIAFWIRVAPEDASQIAYIVHAAGAGGEDALAISLGEVAGQMCICQSSEHLAAIPVEQVCDGLWHHVAFTRAFATMRVDNWLDGVLLSYGTFSVPENTPVRTWIGGMAEGSVPSQWLNGELDALRVYDRVISGDEVATLALPQWRQRTTPVAPAGRHAHGMVYDSARSVTFLFGGGNGSVVFNDTWEWNGLRWALQSPGTSPEQRYDFALAYDSEQGRVVMFGGRRASGSVLGDTWEYYDGEWHQVSTTGPAPRAGCSMVYDVVRQRVVLFGGRDTGSQLLADTWAWNGTAWTNLAPSVSPTARAGHGMVYDVHRDRIVLFGGEVSGPWHCLGDTWEFNGTTWALAPASGPAPRYAIGTMAYDAARELVVLFGNNDAGDPPPHYFRDVWAWDGATWIQWPVFGPPACSDGTMVYDAARKTYVLFGGFPAVGDTWEASVSR
jgi:hypothetical protein